MLWVYDTSYKKRDSLVSWEQYFFDVNICLTTVLIYELEGNGQTLWFVELA
jgi:hypothetical protein